MTNRVSSDAATTWYAYPGWSRKFWLFFLGLAVLFFSASFLFLDDVSWPFVGSGMCNVVVGALGIVNARSRTTVDELGISVVNLRTRFMPWEDVEHVKDDGGGRFASTVVVSMADGAERSLPGVQPTEVPEILRWKPPAPPSSD